MNPPADALESLARFHGIRTSYVDASGVTQRVSCEAVRAILAWSVPQFGSARTVCLIDVENLRSAPILR